MYEDKTLVCKECGNEFVFTAGEQEFYAEKGFTNEPQRCKACRQARKNAAKTEREFFETVCAECGGTAKIPFKPVVQGYAGQQADVLQTAGYTSVEATNPSGTLPASSVVWYQNETDKATAEDVATTLGISAVEQVQGLAVPITVVLLN